MFIHLTTRRRAHRFRHKPVLKLRRLSALRPQLAPILPPRVVLPPWEEVASEAVVVVAAASEVEAVAVVEVAVVVAVDTHAFRDDTRNVTHY
jgi:hypothetical protein